MYVLYYNESSNPLQLVYIIVGTVVEECEQGFKLVKFGFVELKEKDSWEVKWDVKVRVQVA